MPFADLRDGYGCSIDKQIWLKVFASMAQRPAQVDPFQSHFHYAGSIHGYNTRYASQQNLCKPQVCNDSGKQTVVYLGSSLYDKIPLDLL